MDMDIVTYNAAGESLDIVKSNAFVIEAKNFSWFMKHFGWIFE